MPKKSQINEYSDLEAEASVYMYILYCKTGAQLGCFLFSYIHGTYCCASR